MECLFSILKIENKNCNSNVSEIICTSEKQQQQKKKHTDVNQLPPKVRV